MAVILMVSFLAKEGMEDQVREMALERGEFCLTVDGCQTFDVGRAEDDPSRFVMIERWDSLEAHRAHYAKNVEGTDVIAGFDAITTGTEASYFSVQGELTQ